jgi:hypothetical protein
MHEHHPPVGQLRGGPGVGEPQVGGELVGGGLDPPALQQGKQDNDPDCQNNAHDGHGRQDLGQGVAMLVPTNAGNVRPYHAHGLLVDADTGRL